MNKIRREQAKLRIRPINSCVLEHETIRLKKKLQVSTGHIKCSPLNHAGYTSVRPPCQTCVSFCCPWVTDWTLAWTLPRWGFPTTAQYTTNATEPPVHLSPVAFHPNTSEEKPPPTTDCCEAVNKTFSVLLRCEGVTYLTGTKSHKVCVISTAIYRSV